MSTAANIPLVETIGLKKYYKTRKGFLRAVDGIDLQIMQGETLGVVGESGHFAENPLAWSDMISQRDDPKEEET